MQGIFDRDFRVITPAYIKNSRIADRALDLFAADFFQQPGCQQVIVKTPVDARELFIQRVCITGCRRYDNFQSFQILDIIDKSGIAVAYQVFTDIHINRSEVEFRFPFAGNGQPCSCNITLTFS